MTIHKATRNNADQFIRAREDFKTGGALSGRNRNPGYEYSGYLESKTDRETVERFHASDYAVFSYQTPIAWWSEDRGWERPEVRYSPTTSHHQGKCPMTTHPDHGAKVTCGNCGQSWCEACDPAPSALCHYCHGRGYSTAPIRKA